MVQSAGFHAPRLRHASRELTQTYSPLIHYEADEAEGGTGCHIPLDNAVLVVPLVRGAVERRRLRGSHTLRTFRKYNSSVSLHGRLWATAWRFSLADDGLSERFLPLHIVLVDWFP